MIACTSTSCHAVAFSFVEIEYEDTWTFRMIQSICFVSSIHSVDKYTTESVFFDIRVNDDWLTSVSTADVIWI